MTQDSRTRLLSESPRIQYLTSGHGEDDDRWGQPPVVDLMYPPSVSRVVDNVYAIAIEQPPYMDELTRELQAWEDASDEDFQMFEESLRNAKG